MIEWVSFLDSHSLLAWILTMHHRELCLDVPDGASWVRDATLLEMCDPASKL